MAHIRAVKTLETVTLNLTSKFESFREIPISFCQVVNVPLQYFQQTYGRTEYAPPTLDTFL